MTCLQIFSFYDSECLKVTIDKSKSNTLMYLLLMTVRSQLIQHHVYNLNSYSDSDLHNVSCIDSELHYFSE